MTTDELRHIRRRLAAAIFAKRFCIDQVHDVELALGLDSELRLTVCDLFLGGEVTVVVDLTADAPDASYRQTADRVIEALDLVRDELEERDELDAAAHEYADLRRRPPPTAAEQAEAKALAAGLVRLITGVYPSAMN
jgi:hypothetical protein